MPTAIDTKLVTERDRFLDTLRCAAIGRIIVYHTFGFVWLTYVFPAMGVMFALGGSLMANSLSRPGNQAVRNRVRRLLPALWVFAAVVVPAMFWHEFADGDPGDLPGPMGLLLWLVPVAEPGGTEWAMPATVVLWYLVTYLWLVLLSPLLLRAYRRYPLGTVLAPLLCLAVVEVARVDVDSAAGGVAVNLATFGACWVIGFAHRDGRLRSVSLPALVCVAIATMLAGAWWAFTHPADGAVDLNDIPTAQGLYSFGFVLLLMRWHPDVSWLRRVRPLDRLVSLVNARAVTVYLWHNLAITASYVVGEALDVWTFGDRSGDLLCFAIAIGLVGVTALCLGWVEDLAARRRPRLVPV
jgi:hypothetical protein